MTDLTIRFADSSSDLEALADLFAGNITAAYVSHSELMGHRAVRPGAWVGDIRQVLRDEIAERLPQPPRPPFAGNWQGVLEAFKDGVLVGLALVSVNKDSATAHGVVEDIVIDGNRRGEGLGEAFMEWIFAQAPAWGVRRFFLESGRGNDRAHHFFERLGFQPISVVMMREM